MENIGAVGHGNVAQHADRNNFLGQMQCLVAASDHNCQLLVARCDVARGRNVNEQGRENQFQAVLVALIDRG